jgi:H+/Cl- antiporter ClcA
VVAHHRHRQDFRTPERARIAADGPPLGAIITAWLYQTLGPYLRSGTAQVIEIINHGLIALVSPTSAHDDEKTAENISAKMVPLLYLSTMISHLVGLPPARRAGVQIGASVGNYVARLEDVLLPKHLETMTRRIPASG